MTAKQNKNLQARLFSKFKKSLWFIISSVLALLFLFSIPSNPFDSPHSTVLYSGRNDLLSAIIAEDGQWRFPANDSVPQKFRAALLMYEDKNFYEHNGVYLPSVCRALYQNLTNQKVVSGASTISMQVIRLSRKNPTRSIGEKILEMIRAMRLEIQYEKEEILGLYASNAPYGGNVVGLDAAAWRYFGRRADQLSWAESATLAVLPNAPSLIFPGKNQELLLKKRNHVLELLYQSGQLDSLTLELSYMEPLPQKPFALPQTATHLLHTLIKKHGKGTRYNTTIDYNLQLQCNDIVQQHISQLEANLVHNASVLVVEVKTGNVLAYVGNSRDVQNRYGNMVDVIPAPRSTGSILKPFLYAAMNHDGMLLPNTLVPDIPTQFDGFAPQNYSETFDGAVPASLGLSRSLNIPAVIMLKDYGYPRFYHLLQKIGFTQFTKPADHYGLSLILGGGEASLWDITKAYAGMSNTLANYHASNGKYLADAYSKLNILQQEKEETIREDLFPPIDAGSIWCAYRALLEVNRPETELGWEAYSSYTPIAWKTGTSYGNRDAWAVGTTPEFVVGIWVGNADGQGRPMLTGVTSAAPLLFDVFARLPGRTWFNPPYDDLAKLAVCHESGMQPGPNCEHIDTIYAAKAGTRTAACLFHQKIFTNADRSLRMNSQCADVSELQENNWFVLPPVQEYYYKHKHPEYRDLPEFASGCNTNEESPIGLIYPKSDAKIYLPKNFHGDYEMVVLKATHRSSDGVLYWHLDGEFLGETRIIHEIEISPSPGIHSLTLVDSQGQTLVKMIEFIER